MRRLKDAWAVLRGRKRAVDRAPFRTPEELNQSIIGWRYTVSNEALADPNHAPEALAGAISKQAETDVYAHILNRASELRA